MSVLCRTEDADIISNACLVWNRGCWHYNKQWKPCCGVKDANIINNECFAVEPKMLTLWTMNALLWGRRCWHYKQWVSCCGTEYANIMHNEYNVWNRKWWHDTQGVPCVESKMLTLNRRSVICASVSPLYTSAHILLD